MAAVEMWHLNDAAFEERYRALVYKIARKYTPDLRQLDDAVQDGYIGLFRARQSFDPAGGAAFISYAYRGITNAVVHGFWQRRGKNFERAHRNGDGYYEKGFDPVLHGGICSSPEDQFIADESSEETSRTRILAVALASLSETDVTVLRTFSEASLTRYAKECGLSKQGAHARRNKALERVRRAIEELEARTCLAK